MCPTILLLAHRFHHRDIYSFGMVQNYFKWLQETISKSFLYLDMQSVMFAKIPIEEC